MSVTPTDAVGLLMVGFSAGISLFLVVGFTVYGVVSGLRFIESV